MSPNPDTAAAAAFWTWSLAVYRRPGVSDALIYLQDAHGADANIILWCCWRAASGRGGPDSAALADAVAQVAPWRARVIEPLRDLRRDMKAGVPGAPPAETATLRAEIQRAEIEAERVEQVMLAARTPDPASPDPASPAEDPAAEARAALRRYLERLGVAEDAGIRDAFGTILEAVARNADSA